MHEFESVDGREPVEPVRPHEGVALPRPSFDIVIGSGHEPDEETEASPPPPAPTDIIGQDDTEPITDTEPVVSPPITEAAQAEQATALGETHPTEQLDEPGDPFTDLEPTERLPAEPAEATILPEQETAPPVDSGGSDDTPNDPPDTPGPPPEVPAEGGEDDAESREPFDVHQFDDREVAPGEGVPVTELRDRIEGVLDAHPHFSGEVTTVAGSPRTTVLGHEALDGTVGIRVFSFPRTGLSLWQAGNPEGHMYYRGPGGEIYRVDYNRQSLVAGSFPQPGQVSASALGAMADEWTAVERPNLDTAVDFGYGHRVSPEEFEYVMERVETADPLKVSFYELELVAVNRIHSRIGTLPADSAIGARQFKGDLRNYIARTGQHPERFEPTALETEISSRTGGHLRINAGYHPQDFDGESPFVDITYVGETPPGVLDELKPSVRAILAGYEIGKMTVMHRYRIEKHLEHGEQLVVERRVSIADRSGTNIFSTGPWKRYGDETEAWRLRNFLRDPHAW